MTDEEIKAEEERKAAEAAAAGGNEEEEGGDPGKTFTQDELNAILAKEKGKEAARILKEMGVESTAKGAEAIKELAELRKSQMSKEEKLAAELAEKNSGLTAAEQRAIKAETKLAAVKLGVADEYIDDVILLLPDGDGPIEDRLKEFLDKKPVYLKKNGQNIGGPGGKPGGTDPEKDAKERLRKSLGIRS